MQCPTNCRKAKCPSNRNTDTDLDPDSAAVKKPIVWVLGGPGSGKGTQCEKIIAKYGFTHLSTGDLLRAEVKSGSPRAKTLTTIMEKGELVPNNIVLDLLKEAIQEKARTSNGFLIDGYPREKSQGQEFEKSIAPASVILYFEATPDTLTRRCLGRGASSGRADDNEDTIRKRMQTFISNNEQVLQQYPNKLVRINAERNVDEVFNDVERTLDTIVVKEK
ncbi:adenylate kinase domain-containing protein [Phthorimaea operculella]|nr:adenylate kinase domain-containing protein [Phthorimaea operculella]